MDSYLDLKFWRQRSILIHIWSQTWLIGWSQTNNLFESLSEAKLDWLRSKIYSDPYLKPNLVDWELKFIPILVWSQTWLIENWNLKPNLIDWDLKFIPIFIWSQTGLIENWNLKPNLVDWVLKFIPILIFGQTWAFQPHQPAASSDLVEGPWGSSQNWCRNSIFIHRLFIVLTESSFISFLLSLLNLHSPAFRCYTQSSFTGFLLS